MSLLTLLILTGLILALSILKDWLHYKEKTYARSFTKSAPAEEKRYKHCWHVVGVVRDGLVMAVFAVLFAGYTPYAACLVYLMACLRWFVFDFGFNIFEKRNPFERGGNTIEISFAGDAIYFIAKVGITIHAVYLVWSPDNYLNLLDVARWLYHNYEWPVSIAILFAGCFTAYKFHHKGK